MSQIISDVFNEMLGMETQPMPAFDISVEPRFVASIQISGETDEVFVVEAPIASAKRIGEKMFGSTNLRSDEIRDSVGEVVNIIGGNVKGTYPGESSLSLPRVSDETTDAPEIENAESIFVSVAGHPLVVRWSDITSVTV